MHLDDFDFDLPPELIAQSPARERAASRLLHLDGRSGAVSDGRFRALPDLLKSGDVMVFND
ncbi:MAG TPA: S-adenosylmethionine:tRNA ribosyltransferase-isomerase, partial [Burkholderiales bacterium]|nr:S-adenosylmethionine:tRNA ribosyltransferase-isomerase [Burkholderiales bacterium]